MTTTTTPTTTTPTTTTPMTTTTTTTTPKPISVASILQHLNTFLAEVHVQGPAKSSQIHLHIRVASADAVREAAAALRAAGVERCEPREVVWDDHTWVEADARVGDVATILIASEHRKALELRGTGDGDRGEVA